MDFTVHCKHISAVNRRSNRAWHFDDKSTLHPLPLQGLLAKTVSSSCCPFMSYLGRGAVKMLATIQQT